MGIQEGIKKKVGRKECRKKKRDARRREERYTGRSKGKGCMRNIPLLNKSVGYVWPIPGLPLITP